MDELTPQEFQEEVRVWQEVNGYRSATNPEPGALKFGGEAGEFQEAVTKFLEGRVTTQAAADEAGDVLIALAGCLNALGVDLWSSVCYRWSHDVKHRGGPGNGFNGTWEGSGDIDDP